MWLKQSTAVTVKLGPFVDSGDGNTVEGSLTIQKADVRLSKNGGNMAAASADQGTSDAGAPHDEIGYYDVSLDATDTGTLGRLKIMVHESGALPVWLDCMVLPANVWDSLFGSDKLDVNVAEWLGTAVATPTVAGVPEVDVTHLGGVAQSLTDLKDFADDGYDPSTNKVQGVVLTDTVTTYTGNTPQTGDAFARLGAPAGASVSADILAVDNLVDDLESRLGTPSDLGSGATVAANLVDIEAQTDDIGAAGAGLSAVPWNAAWDAEVQSEVDDALAVYDPPTHAELVSEVNAVQSDIAALNNLSAAQVNAEVDAALADARLDELLAVDSDIDGATPPAVGSVVHELMSKTAGSFTYDQTTDSLEAIRDKAGDIETDTQAIEGKVDTVDSNVDAILLDTGTDGVVVGSLTAAAKAEVQQEATDALNAYDPPTGAELVSEINSVQSDIAALSIPSAATIADAVLDEASADHVAVGSIGERIERLDLMASGGAGELTAARAALLDNLNQAINTILTTAMTESYAADGAAPTAAQALYAIQQVLTEAAISGTTMTVKKLDGSTSALVLTLNDADEPTSVTRSS